MSTQKVALVTGGSRGIGAETVRQLKAAGWRVATCARKLESLKQSPADHTFACDVSDVAQVKTGIAGTLKALGRIDAIVNNAAIAGSNSLEANASDDFWDAVLATNLNGPYYFCKYSLPHLPEKTGRIVNIGSTLSLKGVPDQSAYCAAKHGLLGLTRSLSHFLSPRGITVNCVCPGWTRTEMAEARWKELGWTPQERVVEPSEVASLVVYLLSDAAMGISGQALTVDGGALA